MINSNELNWEKMAGLIPVIVQHYQTDEILMHGFMNQFALETTVITGQVTFYSRTKKRLWTKGESSGNYLNLMQMYADCDGDALLIKAYPLGPTCHKGTNNCFSITGKNDWQFLQDLLKCIESRQIQPQENSYTSNLFAQGLAKICQKVGEESVEVILAAMAETAEKKSASNEFCEEAADLLFHLFVLMQAQGIKLHDVIAVLKARHQ